MTETAWPFDGGDGDEVNETGWSRMARVWGGSGIIGYPGDSLVKGFGNSSGRQVKVTAGEAQVRGHHWHSDATVTKAISANTSGNPRIDRVVLRLDPSANTLALAIVEGTPGSSPSAPALTQTDTGTYELPIATVYVANGASTIAAGDVTEERVFIRDRGTPPGMIAPFAGSTAPDGWLLAEGAAVSRAGYAELFAAIGTRYGGGNGSTTFNVPNLTGRVPVGRDASQSEFNSLAETGGSKTRTLTTANLPAHSHVLHASIMLAAQTSTGLNNGVLPGGAYNKVGRIGDTSPGIPSNRTSSEGSGTAFSTLPPYIALNYIIKT